MRALINTRLAAQWSGSQWSGSMARDGLRRFFTAPRRGAAAALVLAAMTAPAFGQGVAAPGNREIRIGVTAPFTGPASAYGVIAKVMVAYMDKVNA
jgi:branched-chain amino acid transport system substrate-binding protein